MACFGFVAAPLAIEPELERSLESQTGFTCRSPVTMSDPPQRSHHDQLQQRPHRFCPVAPRVISIDHDVSGNLRS